MQSPSSGSRSTPQPVTRFIAREWSVHFSRDREVERALEPVAGNALRAGRLALTLRDDTLIAICGDRGVATELRFQQRDLLKTLDAAGFNGIEQVRVRMASSPRVPAPTAQEAAREIPASARRILADTAAAIDDPGLADALRRLARAGASPQGSR